MEVPHRHDLIQISCVNKEMEKFNSIIRKHMKVHENAEVVKSPWIEVSSQNMVSI